METCGAETRVYNNSRRKCQRAKNHKGADEGLNHNYFSDTCPICGRTGCDGFGDCKPTEKKAS